MISCAACAHSHPQAKVVAARGHTTLAQVLTQGRSTDMRKGEPAPTRFFCEPRKPAPSPTSPPGLRHPPCLESNSPHCKRETPLHFPTAEDMLLLCSIWKLRSNIWRRRASGADDDEPPPAQAPVRSSSRRGQGGSRGGSGGDSPPQSRSGSGSADASWPRQREGSHGNASASSLPAHAAQAQAQAHLPLPLDRTSAVIELEPAQLVQALRQNALPQLRERMEHNLLLGLEARPSPRRHLAAPVPPSFMSALSEALEGGGSARSRLGLGRGTFEDVTSHRSRGFRFCSFSRLLTRSLSSRAAPQGRAMVSALIRQHDDYFVTWDIVHMYRKGKEGASQMVGKALRDISTQAAYLRFKAEARCGGCPVCACAPRCLWAASPVSDTRALVGARH